MLRESDARLVQRRDLEPGINIAREGEERGPLGQAVEAAAFSLASAGEMCISSARRRCDRFAAERASVRASLAKRGTVSSSGGNALS